jgi:drug/metabolite transporter (DMT)-like permease
MLLACYRRIPLLRATTLVPAWSPGRCSRGVPVHLFRLAWTGASRMVVFVYLAPCLTALGLHWFLPSERLSSLQWSGVLLAFAGVAIVFADGFVAERASLLGDAFGMVAAALWAATTVVIRTSGLNRSSASKTLVYQLAVAAATLPVASVLLGEPGVVAVTPLVVASLLYQGVIVSFASYLAWFWLLTRYLAARLSVFTFLTPLFGVAAGVVVLGEPLRAVFVAGVVLGRGHLLRSIAVPRDLASGKEPPPAAEKI